MLVKALVSHLCGLTPFSLQVSMGEWQIAALLLPFSEPKNR